MHRIHNLRLAKVHSVKITRILSEEKFTSAQFGAGKFQSFKIVVRPNNAINFSYCRPKTKDFSIKIIYF
jgi:hypothetical protein